MKKTNTFAIRAVRKSKSHPLMYLYNLCDRFKSLPESGSIMDQDCWIMDAFELITRELEHKKQGNR